MIAVQQSLLHAVTDHDLSGSDECFTPEWVLNPIREVLDGIELDVASNAIANEVVGASRYYTMADDALMQSWQARSVFCNPPYSMPLIERFAARMVEAAIAHEFESAVMLVNSSCEARWFQSLAFSVDRRLDFNRRINFWNPIKKMVGNQYRQSLFYWGGSVGKFDRVFSNLGLIYGSPINKEDSHASTVNASRCTVPGNGG